MRWTDSRLLAATLLSAGVWLPAAAGQAAPEAPSARDAAEGAVQDAAGRLVRSIDDAGLREVAGDILDRNPELAGAAAHARAAGLAAPQARALPDPTVGMTAFLAPPETRVGPQRLMVTISQRLPWLARLSLAERSAVLEAAALAADLEARRLELVTEARRLWYELAYVERHREITEEFRRHLEQHEEISRTRYATGVGLSQAVVKLQAEITRVDGILLEIGQRRAALEARLAGLRDRPRSVWAAAPALPRLGAVALERRQLESRAVERRPELAAAAARLARAEILEELADSRKRPDFTLGLTYTAVGRRDDEPGRLQPPPGNGDDVFGIQGGLSLPVRRGKLRAGLEQAAQLRRAAEEARRGVRAGIAAKLDELSERLDLGWRQRRLLEEVLIVQAEEALDSARAGYVSGTLGALDLLDAEHVLFGARLSVARAAADYAIYLARLEGVVAGPLEGAGS